MQYKTLRNIKIRSSQFQTAKRGVGAPCWGASLALIRSTRESYKPGRKLHWNVTFNTFFFLILMYEIEISFKMFQPSASALNSSPSIYHELKSLPLCNCYFSPLATTSVRQFTHHNTCLVIQIACKPVCASVRKRKNKRGLERLREGCLGE